MDWFMRQMTFSGSGSEATRDLSEKLHKAVGRWIVYVTFLAETVR